MCCSTAAEYDTATGCRRSQGRRVCCLCELLACFGEGFWDGAGFGTVSFCTVAVSMCVRVWLWPLCAADVEGCQHGRAWHGCRGKGACTQQVCVCARRLQVVSGVLVMWTLLRPLFGVCRTGRSVLQWWCTAWTCVCIQLVCCACHARMPVCWCMWRCCAAVLRASASFVGRSVLLRHLLRSVRLQYLSPRVDKAQIFARLHSVSHNNPAMCLAAAALPRYHGKQSSGKAACVLSVVCV